MTLTNTAELVRFLSYGNGKNMACGSRSERVALREASAARKARWLDQLRSKAQDRPGYKDLPNITESLRGCDVFITGSTGFMGKVLIEKLLRTFPEVGTIYALIRPKKGKTIEERMDMILKLALFDTIRQTTSKALDKVIPIPGDGLELNLGISKENQKILQENVSYVFHAAATVRFDDPLRTAVLLNTRGTRECVNLAKGMKKLKAFVHVSTTYCNTAKPIIEEKMVEPFLDWRKVISAAEKCSNEDLQGCLHKIIGFQPNTYTFSKQLAEKIVDDAKNVIPAIITRPSVVVSSVFEPMTGWIDNLYGPMGICTGVMKGVLRYTYGDPSVSLDYIPVDAAINAVIISSWIRATHQKLNGKPDEIDVVNITMADVFKFQYYDVMHMREVACEYMPLTNAVRYPRYTLTTCRPYYFIGSLISHVLFAVLVDSILWLTGNQTGLLRLYRTVHNANDALRVFLLNSFTAKSDLFWKMLSFVKDDDIPKVTYDLVQEAFKEENFVAASMKGISTYVFKEPCDLETNKRHLQRLFIIEVLLYFVFSFLLMWCLSRYEVVQSVYHQFSSIICV